MLHRLTQLFPLWALVFSLLAYWQPALLVGGKGAIVPLLMLIIIYTNRPLLDAMIEQWLESHTPIRDFPTKSRLVVTHCVASRHL